MTPQDARQYAPATERNREPILEVLLQVLPESGTILEIASGTGEHAVFFASKLSPRLWLPTDVNPQLRASIIAWTEHNASDNVYAPLELDVREPVWAVENGAFEWLNREPIVAIVNINMIHISPWSACLGLIAGFTLVSLSGVNSRGRSYPKSRRYPLFVWPLQTRWKTYSTE